MSKSLKLFIGTAGAISLSLLAAYNFADRNVSDFPKSPRTLTALPAPIPEPVVAADKSEVADPVAQTAEGGLIAAAHADEGGKGLRFGLGRAALPEEIAAWDVDVRPDGTGLPVGTGNALDGEAVFEENCASCHGSFAEGVDNWPKLAGGEGTLADDDPLKTVGSYWPHLSTVWDYVHRSMPFGDAQSLSDDDVYAIVAYILYSNDLIEDDFELSNETFSSIVLPNADGFVVDDRAETEYSIWRTEPCMENCKDSVEITMRATVLDVTPDEGGDADMAVHSATPAADVDADAKVADASADGDAKVADAVAEADAADPAPVAVAAFDADLAKDGEKVFKKCKACHQVGDKAKNRTGPHLNNILGREIGGLDGFKYSKTMAGMGGAWDADNLAAFLANPRKYAKGTKMAFAGLKKDADIVAVTEYLKSKAQ